MTTRRSGEIRIDDLAAFAELGARCLVLARYLEDGEDTDGAHGEGTKDGGALNPRNVDGTSVGATLGARASRRASSDTRHDTCRTG